MKAEPSLSSMKEQEVKKTVMPFAQMRMKETNLLGPDVTFVTLFFIIVSVLPGQVLHAYLSFITRIYYSPSCTTHHTPCVDT